MHHTTVKIRSSLFIAITDGHLAHPQGVEKLVGLLKDGEWFWLHKGYKNLTIKRAME